MRARIHLVTFVSIAVAAPLGTVGVACSLTTSLDGLTTEVVAETGAAPQGEAGSIAPESGSAAEGGVGADAGVDAAPAPFRCADHAGAPFCADFEATPVTSGWTHVNTAAGGTMAGGAGRFGQGLSASTPSHDTTTNPEAWVESGSLSIPVRQDFTFSVDIKISSLQGGQTDFVGFGFHGPFYILTLRGEGDGKVDLYEFGEAIGDASPQLDHYQPLLVQPALGTWIHVVSHVTFASGNVHLKMTFDDVTAFDGELGADPYAGHPYAHAGISQTTGNGNPTTIVFDDLLFTTP